MLSRFHRIQVRYNESSGTIYLKTGDFQIRKDGQQRVRKFPFPFRAGYQTGYQI